MAMLVITRWYRTNERNRTKFRSQVSGFHVDPADFVLGKRIEIQVDLRYGIPENFGAGWTSGAKWVCLKMGYTPNYSNLVGIMIINHWV